MRLQPIQCTECILGVQGPFADRNGVNAVCSLDLKIIIIIPARSSSSRTSVIFKPLVICIAPTSSYISATPSVPSTKPSSVPIFKHISTPMIPIIPTYSSILVGSLPVHPLVPFLAQLPLHSLHVSVLSLKLQQIFWDFLTSFL